MNTLSGELLTDLDTGTISLDKLFESIPVALLSNQSAHELT
jgi:hypothetical protein